MDNDISQAGFQGEDAVAQNQVHSVEEVRVLLNKAPSLILQAEKTVASCRDGLRTAELAYDLNYAEALNTAEGTVQAKQATATKACKDQEEAKHKSEKALNYAIAALNYANNAFVAIRKEASLIEAEMKSMGYEE